MKESYKKVLFSIIGVFLLITIVFLGVTYAFFSGTVTGSETSSTIYTDAGTMTIDVDGGGNVSAESIMPNTEEPWGTKKVTITGNNDTEGKMPYTLKLVVDNDTFTTVNMQYTLTVDEETDLEGGTPISEVTTPTDMVRPEETPNSYVVTLGSGEFNTVTNVKHVYEISFYFRDNDEDQSVDMSAVFSAHIIVVSSAAALNS